MKITIKELEEKMISCLTNRKLSKKDAIIIVQPFVEAELRDKKTHGIGKFFLIEEALKKKEGKPEIIKDNFNYTLIDAHKELGYISADFATDILIDKAKKYGNSIVGVINSYYYSMAGIYARKVANEGLVSIILNNGGPSATVPFGGVSPIFGTNPIAIGIPTNTEPIVLDMATSEKTWGEINLAKVEGRKLQENTFFDKDGSFTTNPHKAVAIKPFDGVKGYGLNSMFEILTGALVGAKMGLQLKNGYDAGFFFLAFSTEMFTTDKEFNKNVSRLKEEIKKSRTGKNINEIYLPGEQSERKLKEKLNNGYIEIEDNIWKKLIQFENGANIKNKIGMKE